MTARDIIAAAIAEHDGYEHVPARFDGAHAVWATSCQCDGWLIQGLGVDAWERHRADAVAAALRAAGLLPPDGARTLRDDLEFYVNDIRRQLPYLAPGGPREMAEQIAYDLQTLLDAQHTPTEETP